MKKLIVIALTMLGIGMGNAHIRVSPDYRPASIINSWSWDGYDHVVFESGGHWYLEVRSRTGAGVAVIHYESCPCKKGNH